MTRVGFFSGSFDPMTNGHLDVIGHAAALCDRLVIGVGSNPNKAALFTVEERLKLIYEAAAPILAKVECELDVVEFTGLAIEAARKAGATLIFRGLRDGTDFDYEMQMAGMNGAMAPELRTVFLPASSPVRPITATLVRQIASMGGDASAFAPPNVIKALKAKFASYLRQTSTNVSSPVTLIVRPRSEQDKESEGEAKGLYSCCAHSAENRQPRFRHQ